MPKPLQEALRGKWGPGTSGGCPRVPSWTKNPQYLLTPSAAGNFTISLRCNAQPRLDIGFVVLHQAAAGGRKTSAKVNKRELVHKTTWKPIDLQTADIDLRPAESTGAMAYIIVPCTFDAGQQAAFDLTVSSVSGVPFTITELSETPSRPAVQPVQPTAANIAAANVGEGASKPADAGVLAGAGAQPTGSATAKPAGYATADTVAPVGENEVQAVSEGQGLSRRQQADVTKLVAEALASAEQSPTGLYEDEAFSAGPSALWIDGRGPGAELQASVTSGMDRSNASLSVSCRPPLPLSDPFSPSSLSLSLPASRRAPLPVRPLLRRASPLTRWRRGGGRASTPLSCRAATAAPASSITTTAASRA